MAHDWHNQKLFGIFESGIPEKEMQPKEMHQTTKEMQDTYTHVFETDKPAGRALIKF